MADPAVLLGASSSALLSRLICHPLDTMRLRIQAYPGRLPAINSLIPRPLFRGLYAGLPVALAGGGPSLTVYFASYESSKVFLSKYLSSRDLQSNSVQIPVIIASAMCAEVTSGIVRTPMDVVKSRLQRGHDGTSAISLFKKIWREEGYRGMWRGYWMGIVVWGPSLSLYWILYEKFKTALVPGYNSNNSSMPSAISSRDLLGSYLLASSAACAISVSICNPFDAIQARWQTSAGNIPGGLRGVIQTMWRTSGAAAFTRGIPPRILYTLPANVIQMTTYEFIKRYYRQREAVAEP